MPSPKTPVAPPPPSALPPRPVSGAVFVDLDGDGHRGAHEPVLADVGVLEATYGGAIVELPGSGGGRAILPPHHHHHDH